MKCPPEIELNEFAENRLESRRRWEIQEHLGQCDGCRTDLEGLQWVGEQLGLLDFAAETEAVAHPSEADFAALAEGRVDAARKAELLSHIGTCAECATLFGALPRPQRKAVIPSKLYSFAAAAVLLLCLGVFAFTGKLADHRQSAAPTVALHGNGKPQAQKFANKPPTAETEKPASKPVAVAVVKPAEPATPTVAVKPAVKPVAPAKSTPPTPTVVAQVRPTTVTTRATAPVRHVAAKPRSGGHLTSASVTHRARSSRTGRSGYNNTQVAMATPQEVSRAFRGEEAVREGTAGTHDKALTTSPPPPSPAKAVAPGGSMSAMAVRPPGAGAVAQPTTGGAAGAGAPLVTQHSQALSQQFAQSTNDPAEKARLKRASRQLQAGRLAGQKAKGEITRSRGVKGSLKSLAGKSTHHRSSSAGAKFAHQHRTPSASRVAHSQPTGAHAHRGPTHA